MEDYIIGAPVITSVLLAIVASRTQRFFYWPIPIVLIGLFTTILIGSVIRFELWKVRLTNQPIAVSIELVLLFIAILATGPLLIGLLQYLKAKTPRQKRPPARRSR